MKRFTNTILPIIFSGIDLNTVSKIKIKFKQDSTTRIVQYPSEEAFLMPDGVIGTRWTVEDTSKFSSDIPIEFDTQIWLKDSKMNLETRPSSFKMTPSLFVMEEVNDD